MSIDSEKMKRWRKNIKTRIIDSMGGKCQCCDYNKCDDVLVLHHIDPSKKEITIARIRSNPRSWKRIIEELRKCILVCSNCHGEIHAGFRDLPLTYDSFNEAYADPSIRNEDDFNFHKLFSVL